jgi:hypothetical protein
MDSRVQSIAQERVLRRLAAGDSSVRRSAVAPSPPARSLAPRALLSEAPGASTPARSFAERAAQVAHTPATVTAAAARAALTRQVELSGACARERDEAVAELEALRRRLTLVECAAAEASSALEERAARSDKERQHLSEQLQCASRARDALADRQAASEEALSQLEQRDAELQELRGQANVLEQRHAATVDALHGAEAALARASRAGECSASLALEAEERAKRLAEEAQRLRQERDAALAQAAEERSCAMEAAREWDAVSLAAQERALRAEQALEALRSCGAAESAEALRQNGELCNRAAQAETRADELQAALQRARRDKGALKAALGMLSARATRRRAAAVSSVHEGGALDSERVRFYLFSFWKQLARRGGGEGAAAGGVPSLRPPQRPSAHRPPRPPSPTSRARALLASLPPTPSAPLHTADDGAPEDRLLAELRRQVAALMAAAAQESDYR